MQMFTPFIKFGAPFAVYLLILGIHLMIYGRRRKGEMLRFSSFNRSLLAVGAMFLIIFAAYYLPDPATLKSERELFKENAGNKSYESLVKDFKDVVPGDYEREKKLIDEIYNGIDYATPYEKMQAEKMLMHRYSLLWTSEDTLRSRTGSYGLGYMYFNNGDYRSALKYWSETDSSSRPPMLNADMGNCSLENGDTAKAIELYRAELNTHGSRKEVIPRLSHALLLSKKTSELEQLLSDPKNLIHSKSSVFNNVFYHENNLFWFIAGNLIYAFAQANTFSILAALFITLIYFSYFVKIDVFRPKRKLGLLLMLVSGAVLAPLSYYFGIWFDLHVHHPLLSNEEYFTSYLLNPGLVEESIKLIPFLIWMLAYKKPKEPLDYVMYAAASALGFACIENLLYFGSQSQGIIFNRGIISTMFHMVLTAGIAYVFLLYKLRKTNVLSPLLAFIAAIIIHALFNYLIGKGTGPSLIALALIWIAGTYLFSLMINNGLNQSPALNYKSLPDNSRIADFIVFSFVNLLIAQFIFMFVNDGRMFAHERMHQNLLGVGPYLFVLAYCLSNIDIIKGYWETPNLRTIITKRNRNHCMGRRVAISLHEKQGNRLGISSLQGRIVNRFYKDGNHYFLLETGIPEMEKLLLKPETSLDTINNRRPVIVGIWAYIPGEKEDGSLSILGLGWAKSS